MPSNAFDRMQRRKKTMAVHGGRTNVLSKGVLTNSPGGVSFNASLPVVCLQA
jgi:hypothetical protein